MLQLVSTVRPAGRLGVPALVPHERITEPPVERAEGARGVEIGTLYVKCVVPAAYARLGTLGRTFNVNGAATELPAAFVATIE